MLRMAALFLAVICPLFSSDTLTLRDGSQRYGKLVGSSERTITFEEKGVRHAYNISQIESVRFDPTITSRMDRIGSYADRPSGVATKSIPVGTQIAVRTNEDIQANAPSIGRYYTATIERDVTGSGGQMIVPQGSAAQLVVRKMATNSPEVALDLQSVTVAGGSTYDVAKDAKSRGTGVAGTAGSPGSIIAAITGGSNAGIGALSGATMGTGTQVLTRGKNVSVPAQTILTFRLNQPLYLQGS